LSAHEQQRLVRLASERAVHKAFHWLHLHEQKVQGWQAELSAIPAPPFAEQDRALWMAAKFRELGLRDVQLDGVGNVLGWRRGAVQQQLPQRPYLLLSAHLDTVFPVGTDCSVSVNGEGVLHGPGICDNAAGLAGLLALAAAMQFAELDTAGPLMVCANVGEEGMGDLRGFRHLFGAGEHAASIRGVLALEGAGTAVVIDRALGSRRLRVEVTGPGGHSWADAALPNPIFALSQLLTVVANFPLPAQPRTTLHCGLVRGGSSVNAIPESASADLDLRCTDAATLEEIETRLLAAIRAEVLDERLTLTIGLLGSRPAAVLDSKAPLRLALAAVDRHLGMATEARIGSTDANLPLSLGVPAVAIGAGGRGGGIHTLAEWYDPHGRELALRRVLLLTLAAAEQIAEGAELIAEDEAPLTSEGAGILD
jgi:tripeptide aminopeptidase